MTNPLPPHQFAAALQIRPAMPAERLSAAHLALPGLPEPAIEAIAAASRSSSPAIADLWVARRDAELVAAAWCDAQPGKTASLAPPAWIEGENMATGASLAASIVAAARAADLSMLQSLLAFDHGPAFESLRAAGFVHLADILYLASSREQFPANVPSGEWNFLPFNAALEQRFEQVIERTYEQSLDCPALCGIRTSADVLEGYRATGVFDPSRWLLVQSGGADIGCLLLADHPPQDQWELVYMGLAPSARGRGGGMRLVQRAQWLTGQAGRSRLVLAVDVANAPALAHYASAGFSAVDRRSVLVHTMR